MNTTVSIMAGYGTDSANIGFSPFEDGLFTVAWVAVLAVFVIALVMIVRSPLQTSQKLLLVALTVLVPLIGGVAAIVVTTTVSRKAANKGLVSQR